MSKSSSAKFRIVFDTNVDIAAFLRPGLCETLLERANQGAFELYVTQEIMDETLNKLKTKMKVSNIDLEKFSTHIKKIARLVEPCQKLDVIKDDPDDNKILECVAEAKANLIVSLDHHLTDLKSYSDAGIVHPKTLKWIIPTD